MERAGSQRLALLLSMAMFVLVVDTSIMNVSISAVVHDLDTEVSSVQAAISLEALVSAAFILIGSKVADLIGRKRAYVLGLLGYAIGAVSMALAQSVLVVFVFWGVIGGIGASLLATLSFVFTNMAESSDVLKPAQQEQVADTLEHDAEVMSNTALEEQLEGQPEAVRDEIIDINTDARPRALQVALLVPLIAGILGFFTSFRMARLPDPEPSEAGAAAFA